MYRNIFIAGFLSCCLIILSCHHQPYVLPEASRTGDPSICFQSDILPIFITSCAKVGCHDANTREAGYVLDSYDNIVRRGIVPGNSAASTIYESLMGWTEEPMPADGPSLSNEKIGLIKRWIDAGAVMDANCTAPCDSNNYSYSQAIEPLIQTYCLGCHSGTNPQAGLLLNSHAAVKAAVLTKNLINSIKYVPGYPAMPQGGLRLSDCQVRQVEKWRDDDMPDN